MPSERRTGRIVRDEITQVGERSPLPEGSAPIVGATLTVVRGPQAGRLLYVGSMGGLIGRGDEVDLAFTDSAISRRHARLTLRGGQFVLRDLDSANGTFVDDQRVLDEFELPPLCRLRIGRETVLQFAAIDELGREREYQRVLVEERLRFEEEKNQALADQADALRHANEDLERLTGAVGVGLRASLTQLADHARQLNTLHAAHLDAEGVTCLRRLIDTAARMRRQLDGLVRYTSAGALDAVGEVDLDALVDEQIHARAAVIGASGGRVERTTLPRVTGDRGALALLFGELLDNALAWGGDPAPQVRVTAERDDGDWVLAVIDAGPGIEETAREQAFALFEQLAAADDGDRTGLGLALARRIVEAHGGRIWIEDGEEGGSAIRFTLRPAFDV